MPRRYVNVVSPCVEVKSQRHHPGNWTAAREFHWSHDQHNFFFQSHRACYRSSNFTLHHDQSLPPGGTKQFFWSQRHSGVTRHRRIRQRNWHDGPLSMVKIGLLTFLPSVAWWMFGSQCSRSKDRSSSWTSPRRTRVSASPTQVHDEFGSFVSLCCLCSSFCL